MLVAIVESATEYQGKFRELKNIHPQYCRDEFLPLKATTKMTAKVEQIQ